jgi:hypothetical protein
MTRTMGEVSPDARILLRLIGRRHGMGGHFRTGDVVAMRPRHDDGARAEMTVEEIASALRELSQVNGWLGTFRPGHHVFRAYAQGISEDDGNTGVRPSADPMTLEIPAAARAVQGAHR